MKFVPSVVLVALLFAPGLSTAQTLPPTTINYQGRVSVAGAPVEGTGYFKFLLYAPDKRLWSNDDSHTGSEALAAYEPSGNVSVGVTAGLFSADLGSGTMPAITSSVLFDGSSNVRSEIYLRIWFSTAATGPFVRLSPDRRLSSVPFALVAGTVGKGAITNDKLASGSALANIGSAGIGSSFLAPGSAAANLGPSSIGSGLLAPGAVTSDKIDPAAFTALSSTLMQNAPVPTFTALEPINAHDAVAVSKDAGGTVRLIKAGASSGTRSAFYGFAKSAAALGETVPVHQFGPLGGFTGLVGGVGYYLGAADGSISTSLPTGNLAHVYVGSALGADTLFVDPFGVTKRWVTSNYWGNGSDSSLVSTGNVSFPSTQDGDVVVKNFTNLTINAGHTVTTQTRCRGLVIYVDGNCTINGTLTMTARGANVDPTMPNSISPTGIRLVRKKSGGTDVLAVSDVGGIGSGGVGEPWRNAEALQPGVNNDGKVYLISRSGGAGAGGRNSKGAGSSGLAITNGIGGGGAGGWDQPGYVTDYSGSGSAGTCYSGGAGGGGLWNTGWAGFGGNGGTNGGAGGDGAGSSSFGGGGGAGNPGGTTPSGGTGGSGTGGLLVLFVRGSLTVGNSGRVSANGSAGATVYSGGGGGSGGGRVIVLYAGNVANVGSIEATGGSGGDATSGVGTPGGNGGAGSVTIDQIDP